MLPCSPQGLGWYRAIASCKGASPPPFLWKNIWQKYFFRIYFCCFFKKYFLRKYYCWFFSKYFLRKYFWRNYFCRKYFWQKYFWQKYFWWKYFRQKYFFLTPPPSDCPTNNPYLFSAPHQWFLKLSVTRRTNSRTGRTQWLFLLLY